MKLRTANTIVVLWLLAILVCSFIALPSKPLRYTTEKVRVDSVSRVSRYSFMPDMIWEFYTKHGVMTSEIHLYNIGDSLEYKVYILNH